MVNQNLLVDITLSKAEDATGSSDWRYSHGCTKYLMHTKTTAGAAPTTTVKMQGMNVMGGTPKDISAPAAITTSTDTYTEITTFPYKYVRITVATNTDMTVEVNLTGSRSG